MKKVVANDLGYVYITLFHDPNQIAFEFLRSSCELKPQWKVRDKINKKAHFQNPISLINPIEQIGN